MCIRDRSGLPTLQRRREKASLKFARKCISITDVPRGLKKNRRLSMQEEKKSPIRSTLKGRPGPIVSGTLPRITSLERSTDHSKKTENINLQQKQELMLRLTYEFQNLQQKQETNELLNDALGLEVEKNIIRMSSS